MGRPCCVLFVKINDRNYRQHGLYAREKINNYLVYGRLGGPCYVTLYAWGSVYINIFKGRQNRLTYSVNEYATGCTNVLVGFCREQSNLCSISHLSDKSCVSQFQSSKVAQLAHFAIHLRNLWSLALIWDILLCSTIKASLISNKPNNDSYAIHISIKALHVLTLWSDIGRVD